MNPLLPSRKLPRLVRASAVLLSGARSLRGGVLGLLGLAALAACGGSSNTFPDAGAPDAHAGDYRIGAGDALKIVVYNHADLSVDIPVRPDGLISTPLVADMKAAGKTPSELAHDMEKALSSYVRTPSVSIIVTSFVGAYGDQIRVVGMAAKPQALAYKTGMTLMDVMIAVGGLDKFAAGNRASLIRRVDGKEIKINVKLDNLLNRGDISANMPVRPGDVLIIPESRF